MTWFDAVILGLIQGLTEFLPVSSSGHLALARELLNLETEGVAFEVWLHVATLLAVVAGLHKEIRALIAGILPGADPELAARSKSMVLALAVGTIPAVILGLTAKDAVESAFDSPKVVGVGLLLTAAILMASRFLPIQSLNLSIPRALGVGVGQALAIFPGISRSGTTLTTGLALGLSPTEAVRFAFLLAVPAILGATVLKLDALMELGRSSPLNLFLGFVAAAVSGYVAVRVVWKVVERGRLWFFAPYCALVGLLAIFSL